MFHFTPEPIPKRTLIIPLLRAHIPAAERAGYAVAQTQPLTEAEPLPPGFDTVSRSDMVQVKWVDSWEPVETLQDNPRLVKMLTEFSKEQWARNALPPLRLFGKRRDAHLSPLAQQGCYPDEGQRARVYDCALKLTTLEYNPVNPDRDIVPQGRYTICVDGFAPRGADVFHPDGRYVGSVRLDRLADLRRRFDAAQQANGALVARFAIDYFEDEVARLLLRHAAAVKQCKVGRSARLASRHSLDGTVLAAVLNLTMDTAERARRRSLLVHAQAHTLRKKNVTKCTVLCMSPIDMLYDGWAPAMCTAIW